MAVPSIFSILSLVFYKEKNRWLSLAIRKYVKGASLANFDFGDSISLRQAIAEVFDELNSNPESDLTLRFRDPLSKILLKVA